MAVTALTGLLLTIMLIASQGWGVITQALLKVGWGVVTIAAYHLIPMGFSAIGWHALIGRRWAAPRRVFFMARWVREHVGHLLPVAQVGGELVGARLLVMRGLQPGLAGASVVVDLTLEVLTQVLFTLVGVGLLVAYGGRGASLLWIAVGVAAAAAAVAGFILAQRRGLFAWLEQTLKAISARSHWTSLGRIDGLHDAIQSLYKSRRSILTASVYHFGCWMLGTGEVWLALYFMGQPVTWAEALFLESLGEAIRSAAFFIPGQLGVQEGGYMLLGQFIGLAPEIGLALSLVKRVRILLLGLPALLAWQIAEGRRLWAGRAG